MNIYEYDLLNRYSGHTLTKETNGSSIKWELKNGATLIRGQSGFSGNDEKVLLQLRRDLGISDSVLPILTTSERDLVTVKKGQPILNTTTNTVQNYNGTDWI